MTNEMIVAEAYRLIRQKARDIVNPVSDEALGTYVRGVVDLQTELWNAMQKEKVSRNDH